MQDGGPFFDIEDDSFTDVFQASFLGLSAGTHSIPLKIADTNNASLNSTVFIEAGSFTDNVDSIPDHSSLFYKYR